VDWNEAKKEKNITLEYTIESEALGNTGKNACYCAAWFLVGIGEGSLGKKFRVVKYIIPLCAEHFVFTMTNKPEQSIFPYIRQILHFSD
jgi:hypothetical protein